MLDIDAHMMWRTILMAVGGFAFLYLVANEKNRREKWLEFRLKEKIKEAQAESTETSNS
jgi:hypothetical protein